jgi:hypothetical protein
LASEEMMGFGEPIKLAPIKKKKHKWLRMPK